MTSTTKIIAAVADGIIYGIGETAAAARADAIQAAGYTAEAWDALIAERSVTDYTAIEMSAAVAAEIEANGFNGATDSYDLDVPGRHGTIVALYRNGHQIV